FNSKPPLNVWLLVGAFDLFGVGLVPLRLPAALAAWLTILTVFVWSRREAGPAVAALATLVLATTYPFLYVHAGRTANADAPLTLVVTLVFVVLWRARRSIQDALWIGPLAAAALLLKGPGAIGYLAPLVASDLIARAVTSRVTWPWLWRVLAGGMIGTVPVALWAVARWRFDGWQFLGRLVSYDVIGRVTAGVEGHGEPLYYYLLVLMRHHYDWLAATVIALVLAPAAAAKGWRWLVRDGDLHARSLVCGWLVATAVVPTVVSTRLAWYLTPFYPGAAVLTALAVSHARHTLDAAGQRARATVVVGLAVAALLLAEGRLAYRSFVMLDLDRSAQGLIITHAHRLPGARVFAATCPQPEAFLTAAFGGACVAVPDLAAARRRARSGDLWLDTAAADVSGFESLGRNRRASLHRRP
ncbi:MAG TPA: glycosyltransferase family 39 protein, partial [Vicinamibacterales bacterium]|nr:glycosyltransferase family 39 protein [Vicinamibacterales bacterium]